MVFRFYSHEINVITVMNYAGFCKHNVAGKHYGLLALIFAINVYQSTLESWCRLPTFPVNLLHLSCNYFVKPVTVNACPIFILCRKWSNCSGLDLQCLDDESPNCSRESSESATVFTNWRIDIVNSVRYVNYRILLEMTSHASEIWTIL